MVGLLKYNGDNWVVNYFDIIEKELPLYYKEEKEINKVFNVTFTKEVEFEIVDEFSHPHLFYDIGWGDGIGCAKLIKKK